MVPNASIVSGFQPDAANMHRADAEIGKTVAESVREILIEQQFHFVPVTMSRRAISREREARADVFARQIRKISKDFIVRHARREVVEHNSSSWAMATRFVRLTRGDGVPFVRRKCSQVEQGDADAADSLTVLGRVPALSGPRALESSFSERSKDVTWPN
jgi:hypothetical protein